MWTFPAVLSPEWVSDDAHIIYQVMLLPQLVNISCWRRCGCLPANLKGKALCDNAVMNWNHLSVHLAYCLFVFFVPLQKGTNHNMRNMRRFPSRWWDVCVICWFQTDRLKLKHRPGLWICFIHFTFMWRDVRSFPDSGPEVNHGNIFHFSAEALICKSFQWESLCNVKGMNR